MPPINILYLNACVSLNSWYNKLYFIFALQRSHHARLQDLYSQKRCSYSNSTEGYLKKCIAVLVIVRPDISVIDQTLLEQTAVKVGNAAFQHELIFQLKEDDEEFTYSAFWSLCYNTSTDTYTYIYMYVFFFFFFKQRLECSQ